MSLASNLTLYSSTSMDAALRMRPSVVEDFFSSKPFDDWKKGEEAKSKLQAAIVGRLDGVTKGIGVVAKILSQKRGH